MRMSYEEQPCIEGVGASDDGLIKAEYKPPRRRHARRGKMIFHEVATNTKIYSDNLDPDDAQDRTRFINTMVREFDAYSAADIKSMVDDAMRDHEKLSINPSVAPIASESLAGFNPNEGEFSGSTMPTGDFSELPVVMLPGTASTVSTAAATLAGLLDNLGGYYVRGGVLVTVADEDDAEAKDNKIIKPITSATLVTEFEKVSSLKKYDKEGNLVNAVCTEATAKVIAAATVFRDQLPKITLLSNCPVLIERSGKIHEVSSYDRESGIKAFGKPTVRMKLAEAKAVLELVLKDFNFATPSDRSRAFAALLTPALIQGGLLGGRTRLIWVKLTSRSLGKVIETNSLPRFIAQHRRLLHREGNVEALVAWKKSLIQKS